MAPPLGDGRISYLLMPAFDLRKMTAFYRDVLGLRLVHGSAEEGWIFLTASDGSGPSIGFYRGTATTEPGELTIVFDVDLLEESVARLKEVGIPVGDTISVPYGRAAIFQDPEGRALEVHQPQLR